MDIPPVSDLPWDLIPPPNSAADYGEITTLVPPATSTAHPDTLINKILGELTKEQHEAATRIDIDLLVLAGPGTGKTKTLTSRLAYIIAVGSAWADQILAVTFTNKAADEMRRRAQALTDINMKEMWVGTFHGICNRIIRENHTDFGLPADYTIIDAEDQEQQVKNVLLTCGFPIHGRKKQPDNARDMLPVRHLTVAAIISRWKDDGITPAAAEADDFEFLDHRKIDEDELSYAAAREIYRAYNTTLREHKCLDFGDLLLECVLFFESNPAALAAYQDNWRHVLVDEGQDANKVQNRWIALVSAKAILAEVADDDQTIYEWRGADVRHLLEFQKRRPNSQIVRLTQNFRSTGHIVQAARGLIRRNTARYDKNLWTRAAAGADIRGARHPNNWEEARGVIREIQALARANIEWREIAVLVRAGWLSIDIEQELLRARIPYVLSSKTRFLDRKEIKDILALVRLCHNLHDDLAFERAILRPKRGLGEQKLEKLKSFANRRREPIIAACLHPSLPEIIGPKIATSLGEFATMIDAVRWSMREKKPAETILDLAERSGYAAMLREDAADEENADSRIDNIETLSNLAADFDTTADFLEHIQLATEIGRGYDQNAVRLSTIHGSKGLEFRVVFLPGWEEGVMPSLSLDAEDFRLEEERRLAYVALTRARERVYLSWAEQRRDRLNKPSPFLQEIAGIQWGRQ